jgi:hypothetical protein
VDDDVAKSREGFEPAHHLGGKTRVPPPRLRTASV